MFKLTQVVRKAGALSLVLSAMLPLAAEAQWVFVAHRVMGRVQQVTQEQDQQPGQSGPKMVTQVATVILEAPAKRVFEVATNATNTSPNVTVVSNDPASMTIKLSEGDQTATLKATSLSKSVSQLMIVGSAPAGENPETTRIVNAVLRLCGDLGKTCQLSN